MTKILTELLQSDEGPGVTFDPQADEYLAVHPTCGWYMYAVDKHTAREALNEHLDHCLRVIAQARQEGWDDLVGASEGGEER